MTAIAIIYDHVKNLFVASADGRCELGDGTIASDSVQKIFSTQQRRLNAAYSMSGLATIGSVETIKKLHEQIETLSKRNFSSGYEFANKVSFNVKRIFEKALEDERLPNIPSEENAPENEKGRFLKIFLLGFYGKNPFLTCHALYFHGKEHPIERRQHDTELSASQSRFVYTGSDPIAAMLFGNAPLDPRLETYKREIVGADALKTTTTYIRACSDEIAVTIDPYCHLIGGHIHAAEVTKNGFNWLNRPFSSSTQT